MKFILASASPRRSELLKQICLEFQVKPCSNEEVTEKEKPYEVVMDLARQKAENIFARTGGEGICVIGADTVVVYNGEILGKPEDEDEAFNTLAMLQDRTHQVYTGVCLVYQKNGRPKCVTFYGETQVTLYPIDRPDIRAYIATGDPLDKAGSYGIQGLFARHIKALRGEYTNVVGLPLGLLYQHLLAEKLV